MRTDTRTGAEFFSAGAFSIPVGPEPRQEVRFSLRAPTTAQNVQRVLRGLQLPKPILLEGLCVCVCDVVSVCVVCVFEVPRSPPFPL